MWQHSHHLSVCLPNSNNCSQKVARGFIHKIRLLIAIMEQLVNSIGNVQLAKSDYKRLLNKPYVNEDTLRGQTHP